MMEAFLIVAGIGLALCIIGIELYIMFNALRPLRFVFVGGSGQEYRSEITAFTQVLKRRLPGKIERIEATPSHIYYLIGNTKADRFNESVCQELTIGLQREVAVYPTQNGVWGVWLSVHYHDEVEESYKPYQNVYPK